MADLVGKITVRNSISGKIRIARTMYENDYEQLMNLPRINGVVIIGDLSFEDLGLIFDGVTIVASKSGMLFVKDNSHKHIVENISDFPEWAKRDTKPEYTAEEVGADGAGAAQNALTTAKNYVDKIIEELVNGAPEMLDTLGELADAMENNQSAIEALEKIAASKASQTDLNAHINDKNNPHAVTKSTIGLGNVENKSSATIRGELTKENVTKALGYTPSESDTTYTEATQSKSGLLSAVDKTKLDGIENGAQKNTITGVKGNAEAAYRTGQINLTPANIGLDKVNNTADSEKSVASAAKLTTARTINDTSFNGSANIRLSNSFNLSCGATGNEVRYCVFAKMTLTNDTGNMGATIIATDFGNFGETYPGVWLIQLSNRGSKPSMEVTVLREQNGGTVTFGYYISGSEIYFGVHTSAYRGDSNITVLRNTGVTFQKFSDSTTVPSGWTVATVRMITDATKLPLAGGTMTGDIKRTAGSYTGTPIAIYSGDANGAGMVIQMGGRVIIGSGESGANLRTALGTTTANEAAEIMYVASDNEIHLVTNCQTIANRKDVVISTAGNVNAPGGFTGSLSGNAATASKLQTARTINGVVFDGSQNITIPGDTALTSKVNMKSKTSDIFRLF